MNITIKNASNLFRIQNMKIAADGSSEYKGAIDVLVKVCKQEGVFALWKGFWPYYFRLGPHTVRTKTKPNLSKAN
jgi:solute carrier family 25 (mitochondrial oxoglutarate transporter), member 11